MTLSQLKDGDTFTVNGTKYRAMIRFHDAWGCRHWEGNKWSRGHTWFKMDQDISDYKAFTPRSLVDGNRSADPMMGG